MVTREVLQMFWIKKATAAALTTLLLVAAGFGIGMSVQGEPRAAAQEKAPANNPDPPAGKTEAKSAAELVKEPDRAKQASGIATAFLAAIKAGKVDEARKAAALPFFTPEGTTSNRGEVTGALVETEDALKELVQRVSRLPEQDRPPTDVVGTEDYATFRARVKDARFYQDHLEELDQAVGKEGQVILVGTRGQKAEGVIFVRFRDGKAHVVGLGDNP